MRGRQGRLRVSITKGRERSVLFGASIAAAAIVAGVYVVPATAASCPNEQLRQESNSTQLSDCRAFEMVSPTDKNGADVTKGGGVESSLSGDQVAFESPGSAAFGDQRAAGLYGHYLASLQSEGWSTEGLDPPLPPTYTQFINSATNLAFTPDLEKFLLSDPAATGPDEEPKVGTYNETMYLRDNVDGSFRRLMSVEANPAGTYNVPFIGASEDLEDAAFESPAAYTPEAPVGAGDNVYETVGGHIYLESILPDGTIATIAHGGSGYAAGGGDLHAVSRNGSRVIFTDASHSEAEYELYDREDNIRTLEVSASRRAIPDPHGPQEPVYRTASADGSKVLFTSKAELTEDANTGTEDQGADLYEYDAVTDTLTDLTADTHSGDPNGAGVLGVIGRSEDASYVYFVAEGQFGSGEGEEGAPNVFLWHEGTIRYVATLSPADSADWQFGGYGYAQPSRVTADGEHMLLSTVSAQPGYDNNGFTELYLYAASGGGFACVSCNPSGAPATTGASIVPAEFSAGEAQYEPRHLSEDGTRVYFETPEALVPGDVNATGDVYEWTGDAPGSGEVRLISSGRGLFPAIFGDASQSGSSVFFMTRNPLVPQDTDQNVDVYDARVDGGLPASSAYVGGCQGDACQGPASPPPATSAPASTLVNGAGNVGSQALPKPKPKPKSAPLTRAQKLAKALKTCKGKPRRRRASCERSARKRYGSTAKAKKSSGRRK
jgi:hypothetical protein